MNKTLKFQPQLIPLILTGKKTATWRLFDDKNLAKGDTVDFVNSETKEKFAVARLVDVFEKPFGNLTDEDKFGHEPYESQEEMLKNFSECYHTEVTPDTFVKIIRFELI